MSWLPHPAGPSSPACGVITPIGLDPASFWDSAAAAAAAASAPSQLRHLRPARPHRRRDPRLRRQELRRQEGPQKLRVMARTIQLAVAAAQLALDDRRGQGNARPDALRRRVRRRPDRHASWPSWARPPRSAPTVSPAPSIWKSGASRAGRHPAAVDAQVPAQHARLPRLDPARRAGAQQHHHRKRRGQPAGAGRGVSASWAATRPISSSSAAPRARSIR